MAFPSDRPVFQQEPPSAWKHADAVPVRLHRSFEITPTNLGEYRDCPRKFRLDHIDRIRGPWRYEEHFAVGRAVHRLLADVARRLRVRATLPTGAALVHLAADMIPRDHYPSADAYGAVIRKVVVDVEAGIRYLIGDPDSAIFLYESTLKRPYVRGDRLRLSFRVDVARWTADADADGEFIEIIDYKTGKRRDDDELPVFARFVINPLLEERECCWPWNTRVRFTYVWLDAGESIGMDLDAERCRRPWRTISTRIEQLFVETEWAPRPSALCKWCRFYRVACDGLDAVNRPSPGLVFEELDDGRVH